MKDYKFKNIITGEIVKASNYYYAFALDCYNNGEEGNRTISPKDIPKKELIELGYSLLSNDSDWERL